MAGITLHLLLRTWGALSALALAFALTTGASAQSLTVAGEWSYAFYGPDRQPTGQGRVILLDTGSGTHKLRFSSTETERHACIRSDLDAVLSRQPGKLLLTVDALPAHRCPAWRLVLQVDGTGGLREVRDGNGTWRADGLARGLRKLTADAAKMAVAPATAPPVAKAAAGPRLRARALVIGNGAYLHFGKLPNPRHDAEAIAAKFRSLGIPTDLVLDADRDALAKALNDYQSRAAGTDLNILFFAGHGVQVEGINYLVPTNMRADGISAGYIKLTGISLNAALDYLPAKTRLVFLDACRDNPASRSLAGTRGGGAGLAPVVVNTSGTLIAYATKDGATAEDGQGRHSPYTAALLEHLSRPQDIAVVLRHVRQSVMQATSNRQEPWEYGSLVGDQLVLARMAR